MGKTQSFNKTESKDMENVGLIDSNKLVPVTFFHGQAFTNCDCGAELILSRLVWGFNAYKGTCPKCGKRWNLTDKKLFSELN